MGGGGIGGDRTLGLLPARQALSQLSYDPFDLERLWWSDPDSNRDPRLATPISFRWTITPQAGKDSNPDQ